MPLDVPGPNVGDTAPDFSLPEADEGSISLANLRGRTILLVFYRGYW